MLTQNTTEVGKIHVGFCLLVTGQYEPFNVAVNSRVDDRWRHEMRHEEHDRKKTLTLRKPQFQRGRHTRPVRANERDGSEQQR